MLYWAFVFLIIGIIAAIFGFGGIAGAAIGIAKVIFFIFIALFVIFLILGFTVFRRITGREGQAKKKNRRWPCGFSCPWDRRQTSCISSIFRSSSSAPSSSRSSRALFAFGKILPSSSLT